MTSQRSLEVKFRILPILTLSIVALTVLIALAAPAIAQNPVPFIDQPLVPDAAAPGGAEFTLTVNGAGFVAGSVVNWNGSPRATTFVSRTKLTAAILASDIAKISTATVTVVSPSPGGGVSNTQFFSIAVPKSSASFLPAVTYDSGGYIAQSVQIADLKTDGKLDIVVANWWDTNNVGVVGVLLGNGDGTFQPAVNYETGGAPNYSLVVADVNGDGKPDLIVSSCAASASTCGSAEGVVSVLLGNGNGTFQPALTYSSGAPVGAHVAVADVNGDGKPDLIVTNFQGESNGNGTVAVLLCNGNVTFRLPVLYDSGAPGANVVAVADVNGGGVLDLLVADGCYYYCSGGGAVTRLSVLLGNGDGTFQPAVTYATGGNNSGWVSVADVNGDGKPDAVLGNSNLFIPNGTVSVLLGIGNGTFEPAVTYDSGGYAAVQLALGDLTADGHLDIIVDDCGPVGACGTGVLGVLLGRGDGTFDPVVTLSTGVYNATAIAVADLNGDGRLDLVAANQCAVGGCTTGSVSVLLNKSASLCVGKCATSTTLTSSLNPSIYGQSVTWTAKVTTSGPLPPTGEVNFTWGDSIGGAPLNASGVATLTRSTENADTYPLTAVYEGDANNAISTSAVLNQVIKEATSTATLTSSPNPSTQGQAVTFTAIITSPTVTATGPVTFTAGKTVLGTGQLSGGKATFTTSTLPTGTTPITATYYGDSNIAESSASVVQTVTSTSPNSTITTLSASPNPSQFGEQVTFTAKVTSSQGAPPNGEIVTFYNGSAILGPGVLSGGETTLVTSSLPGGTFSITAKYGGDPTFLGSTSSPLSQIVQTSPTAATVTWVADPPQNETFAATVTGPKGIPTGTVTFTVGSTTLGTVTLSGGVAALTVSTLAVGSNTVTATYSGDANNPPTSAWTTQTFVVPYNATLYLQQMNGMAGAITEFGTGTTPANFVEYYSGLPNDPDPAGQVLVGSFTAGTIVNFGMFTQYSQSGWAFSDEVGANQAALISFADLSNALGLNHSITQPTSSTTWVLWLDDAVSYLYDDDNNDVIMEILLVPN